MAHMWAPGLQKRGSRSRWMTSFLLVFMIMVASPACAYARKNAGKGKRGPAPSKATSGAADTRCGSGPGSKSRCPPAPPAPPGPLSGLPLSGTSPPNFVVVVTDDQDEVLGSADPAYMPALHRLIGASGSRFANTLVSTSVCCPARVSLLTGRLSHCSNVTANWYPAGAFGKFVRGGLDGDWLPGWLQAAGYHTVLVGKFLNSFGVPLPAGVVCPRGWDSFEALTTGTYALYNSTFSLNCGPSTPPLSGQYQTDLIRDKALAYIDTAVAARKPLYLHLTPATPHKDNNGEGWVPPPPAARHAGLYPGLQLPANPTLRTPNPLIPDTRIDMTKAQSVQQMTDLYVGRLRALRAVDDMLEALVNRLEARGILNNTYIIFTSDNGLHMGQHSLLDGKGTNLEEDNRVPLFIRGPGVEAGVVSPYQANLIDIPATILALAGLPQPRGLDGLPLPLPGLTTDLYDQALRAAVATTTSAPAVLPYPSSGVRAAAAGSNNSVAAGSKLSPPPIWRRESVILEAWDSDSKAGYFPGITFKALRLCSTLRPNFTAAQQKLAAAGTSVPPALMVPQPADAARQGPPVYCLKYSVWCKGNRRELYDLSTDPYEQTNLAAEAPAALLSRLDAVLSVLVHCKGADCAHPYGLLHPAGDVLTFEQAMAPAHDALYASLPRFAFASCYPLYLPANERTFTLGVGPRWPGNASWESTGITWPLPGGARGLTLRQGGAGAGGGGGAGGDAGD